MGLQICLVSVVKATLTLSITLHQVTAQTLPPIDACNDPLVEAHQQTYSHSYCFHTCGFLRAVTVTNTSALGTFIGGGQPFGDSADAYCHSNGYCVCQPACPLSAPRNETTPDPTICDPNLSIPDPTARARCTATCTAQCGGAMFADARVCREVALLGPNRLDANICTCNCSPTLRSCVNIDLSGLLTLKGVLLSYKAYLVKLFALLSFKIKYLLALKKLAKFLLLLFNLKAIAFHVLKTILVIAYYCLVISWIKNKTVAFLEHADSMSENELSSGYGY